MNTTLPSPEEKILTLDTLRNWRENLRLQKKKLVVTNGCFDILHRGHVDYLYKARVAGDALLVLINSDHAVRLLKGSTRPVTAEADRAFVLAGLGCVDAVLIFDAPRCSPWLSASEPDIYAKGGDYTLETLEASERDALLRCGSEIIFIPFVQGFSTTGILSRI